MWYVVQTLKGREGKVLDEILQYVTQESENAFIIENEKMYKHQGEWHAERENLFAGYLFIDTGQPEEFNKRLQKQDRTLKLLSVDGRITPIREDEEKRLLLLGGEDHVVKYSEGFKDGDVVRITSGALKGFDGEIKRMDRHNRRVQVMIPLFGRDTPITLGLGIVKST